MIKLDIQSEIKNIEYLRHRISEWLQIKLDWITDCSDKIYQIIDTFKNLDIWFVCTLILHTFDDDNTHVAK